MKISIDCVCPYCHKDIHEGEEIVFITRAVASSEPYIYESYGKKKSVPKNKIRIMRTNNNPRRAFHISCWNSLVWLKLGLPELIGVSKCQ